MFAPIRTEIAARFAAVELFFKASHGRGQSTGVKAQIDQTARGLAFVQMYAAYEYAVCAVVRTAVDRLVARRHPLRKLRPSLLALFLDPELSALKQCSGKRVWEKRSLLFQAAFSKKAAAVQNCVMPHDGTNFESTQLRVIFDVFGIKRTPARRLNHLARINEVVEHRNAIAHGRETAESVGKGCTRADVLHRIKQMKSVCLLLVTAVESHCSNPEKHQRRM
jgi:hypothetical protein